MCGSHASRVGSTSVRFFLPPAIPKFNGTDNFRLHLRSGATNDFTRFTSITGALMRGLGRSPHVIKTASKFGPGFPRCLLGISVTGTTGLKMGLGRSVRALRSCVNDFCSSGFVHFKRVCGIVLRTSPRCHVGPRSLCGFCTGGGSKGVMPCSGFVAVSHVFNPGRVAHCGVFASTLVANRPTRKIDSKRIVRTIRRVTGRALPHNCSVR